MDFAGALRSKMTERHISVRRLAATWRPATPESARRNLYKYLDGQEPSDRIVAEIAAALEVPVEELTGTQDEEEDIHQMIRDLRDQLRALTSVVDRADRKRSKAAA